jgi:hypothetical protein
MNPSIPSSTHTVLGRPLTLRFEDGSTRDTVLQPFRVKQFMPLFPHFDKEPVLVAHAVNLAEGEELTPESYDEVATALQELNRPFFNYCSRRLEKLQQTRNPALERAAAQAIREALSTSGAGSSASPRPAT